MTENIEDRASAGKTWLIILLLILVVLFQGAISYVLIGNRGMLPWLILEPVHAENSG